jgi:hypothetical protein
MTERNKRGLVGRRMTLEQRHVLLERIRKEVEGVVEDIQATAASLGAAADKERMVGATERATLNLIWEEQQRQRLELERLYGEYDSLAFRRRVGTVRTAGAAAA